MGVRRRAPQSSKRTYIPREYLEQLGNRIRLALQDEHVAYNKRRSQRARFSTERACSATGIPYASMLNYLQGKRLPNILDMRDIAEFSGVSVETLMSVIPSRKQLDQLLDQEEARVRQEASVRAAREDEEDEDDD